MQAKRGAAPRGLLVAVEGIDGSGVSTLSRLLVERLRAFRECVVYTKEPTHSPIGALIRSALASKGPLTRPDILALLFAADRIHHLYEAPLAPGTRGIIGALRRGCIAVADRYKYSSLAYQSISVNGVPGAPLEWLLVVNAYAPPAHVLVYLDVDPDTALERIRRRSRQREVYEALDALRELRESYKRVLALLSRQPEWPRSPPPPWHRLLGDAAELLYPPLLRLPRIIVLEATAPPGALAERVLREIVAVTGFKHGVPRGLGAKSTSTGSS